MMRLPSHLPRSDRRLVPIDPDRNDNGKHALIIIIPHCAQPILEQAGIFLRMSIRQIIGAWLHDDLARAEPIALKTPIIETAGSQMDIKVEPRHGLFRPA